MNTLRGNELRPSLVVHRRLTWLRLSRRTTFEHIELQTTDGESNARMWSHWHSTFGIRYSYDSVASPMSTYIYVLYDIYAFTSRNNTLSSSIRPFSGIFLVPPFLSTSIFLPLSRPLLAPHSRSFLRSSFIVFSFTFFTPTIFYFPFFFSFALSLPAFICNISAIIPTLAQFSFLLFPSRSLFLQTASILFLSFSFFKLFT